MKINDENTRIDLDYLSIFNKWKIRIITSSMIVIISSIVFSLFLPKKYKATVLFLPPASNSGLSSLIGNFSFDVLGTNDISGDACLTVLKSRALRTEIIEKYQLMKLYKKKYIEHALKELDKNVIIQSEVQMGIGTSTINSVSINVIDKQPDRAANIANDIFKLLESRIIELNIIKAKNNRLFLEKRISENIRNMSSVEDSLKAFQEKFGAIEITSQAQAAIETAAKVKAQLIKAITVRDAISSSFGEKNSNVRNLQAEIDALTKEYERMHNGKNDFEKGKDVLIPFNNMPDIGLHYYRLLRETKVQNKLYEMLIPIYEQAKIQEEKNVPVLRVIDYAIPPTYKFKPKRVVIVLGIVAVYLSFLMLFIFSSEYFNRLRDEDAEKFKKIRKMFSLRNR